jgi:hypothetical protein
MSIKADSIADRNVAIIDEQMPIGCGYPDSSGMNVSSNFLN